MSREDAAPAPVPGLTARQAGAVALLLAGRTYPAVARSVGVGRTTLYRWRQLPAFRQALLAGQRGMFASAVARLSGLTDGAIDQLSRLLRSEDERVVLAACVAVLKGAEGHVLADLEQRLAELEERRGQEPDS
jgi:transposase-like protein